MNSILRKVPFFFFLGLYLLALAISGHRESSESCGPRHSDETAITMKQLSVLLADYKRVCGSFPTTEQGLEALVRSQKIESKCKFDGLKRVPKDGWDLPLAYHSNGPSQYQVDASHGYFLTNDSPDVQFPEGQAPGYERKYKGNPYSHLLIAGLLALLILILPKKIKPSLPLFLVDLASFSFLMIYTIFLGAPFGIWVLVC